MFLTHRKNTLTLLATHTHMPPSLSTHTHTHTHTHTNTSHVFLREAVQRRAKRYTTELKLGRRKEAFLDFGQEYQQAEIVNIEEEYLQETTATLPSSSYKVPVRSIASAKIIISHLFQLPSAWDFDAIDSILAMLEEEENEEKALDVFDEKTGSCQTSLQGNPGQLESQIKRKAEDIPDERTGRCDSRKVNTQATVAADATIPTLSNASTTTRKVSESMQIQTCDDTAPSFSHSAVQQEPNAPSEVLFTVNDVIERNPAPPPLMMGDMLEVMMLQHICFLAMTISSSILLIYKLISFEIVQAPRYHSSQTDNREKESCS